PITIPVFSDNSSCKRKIFLGFVKKKEFFSHFCEKTSFMGQGWGHGHGGHVHCRVMSMDGKKATAQGGPLQLPFHKWAADQPAL
ncbi:MAG: hypothetical protein IKS83_01555, partial [Victivallales bacterium]|nr:hypothetical protein [Victivallales bacterium]